MQPHGNEESQLGCSSLSNAKFLLVSVSDSVRSLADEFFSTPMSSLVFGLLNRCSVPSSLQPVVAIAPIALCNELFALCNGGLLETRTFGDALFRLVRDLSVSTSSQRVPMLAMVEYLRCGQQMHSYRHLSEPLLCFFVGFLAGCSADVIDSFLQLNALELISARVYASLNSALELSLYPFHMAEVMISEALRSSASTSSSVEAQTLSRIQSLIRGSLNASVPESARANVALTSASRAAGSSELQHLEQLCTVSSSTPGVSVSTLYLLLSNTGLASLQRRSSRAASFTHNFEAGQQQVELTLEFPMQVMVREVQVASHAAGGSGSPSAIALEVDGGETLCLCRLSTVGLTTFAVAFETPVVVHRSVTLHLYRPKDPAAPMALSRISLLGHTVLTTPSEAVGSPALTQWLRLMLAALGASSANANFTEALEHTFPPEFLSTLLHLYLLSAARTTDSYPSEHITLSKILQQLLLLLNSADTRLSDQLIPLFLEAIRGIAVTFD